MEQSITLYYLEGSSDKIYQAGIVAKGDGYVVNFAFGRRGSTLHTGTKTQTPVDRETATAILSKLIKDKQAKGYTPGEDGTPYTHTNGAKQRCGVLPMLLNPVEEGEAKRLITDSEWLMQEKFDGKRMLIKKLNGEIIGINKLGFRVGLPLTLLTELERYPHDCILDGEIIGDHYHPFDLLFAEDDELAGHRLVERLLRLMNLLASFQHPHVHFIETAYTPEHKAQLFASVKRGNREGVVFKHREAPYIIGRPASGGKALKYKFQESASFVVSGLNKKRSVSLSLRRGTTMVEAGNVTIPANQSIPSVGAVVEVRYLYAFPESGNIFQPVYLGERDDVTTAQCTLNQLKFKPEAAVC